MIPRSPTSTSQFMACPLFYTLKREWQPRGTLWTPNQLLGSAIGDALSEHYRGHERPVPEDTLRRVILEGYRDNDTWTRDSLVRLAQRGYERAAQDGLRESGEVLMVDEALPSRARPDLVQRVRNLGLTVTDTKCTLKGGLDRLSEYTYSHQLFHYAWEVEQVLGEPVEWCRIHYVMLTPLNTVVHPVQISRERLALWLKGVEPVWARMAAGESGANFNSCMTKYGPCEMRDACHVLDLDPDRMESMYERVPPRA